METARLHAGELRRSLEGLVELNRQESARRDAARGDSTSPQVAGHKQRMRSNHARETERMIDEVRKN